MSAVEVVSNFREFSSLSADDIDWEFEQKIGDEERKKDVENEREVEEERKGEEEKYRGEGRCEEGIEESRMAIEKLGIEEDDVNPTPAPTLSLSRNVGKYAFNSQFSNAFNGLHVSLFS